MYQLADSGSAGAFGDAPSHEVYALQWASKFAVPAMLISLDLRLIWANAAGQDLLLEGGDLIHSGGALAFADKNDTSEFRSLLSRLGASPTAWIYGRASGESGLIRAELIEPEGHSPAAAIMIFRPPTAQRYYWGDIGKLFGLTKAEAEVVKRMVAGESAKVMAEALGVSLETIRTHIRRIYNKMDVVGREELIATVSAYRTT